ncbi:taf11 protein [Gorgonomyces haynaldii]|nr:taf11 protein [Gorgonomyces haynaldii]
MEDDELSDVEPSSQQEVKDPLVSTESKRKRKKKEEEEPKEEEEEDVEDDEYDLNFQLKPLQEDRQAIKALLDTFDEEQLQRYEAYRRAHLPKAQIKKMVSNYIGQSIPQSVAIIVAGVGKVFVGELTEMALSVMEERGDKGPIRPVHLREAFRRYRQSRDRIPNRGFKKRLF